MKCQDGSEEEADQIEGWYWVEATYKSVQPGVARRRHFWQTIVFLIRGPWSDDTTIPAVVKSKAEEVARRKEREYEASSGHTVRWVFQQIDAMAPLVDDDIVEGTDVYWEFYEKVDRKPAETVAAKG